MEVKFTCPNCSQKLEADASLSGVAVQCPACGGQALIPAPEMAPGSIVGNFKIERVLGTGAMGEVYLATQVSMQRPVALKVLPPGLTEDREYVKRFSQEVQTLGRLNHPNIVTAYEAGEDSGHHYLAMEFVDGEDLESCLERDGMLDEAETLRIGRRVADALCYAWEDYEVLHRDVKPANIMIDRNGQVRLTDLGISKQASDDSGLTMSGYIIGTPHFMSPEQARSRQLDCRADIYALGATMYNMLTNRTPFDGETTMNILAQLISDEPLPIRDFNPGVSDACLALVERMMAKDKEDRYQSWEEVVEDFDRVMAGELPASAAAPEPQVPAAPKPNWPLRLAVAGVGLLLAAVVGAGIYRAMRQPAPVAPEPEPDPVGVIKPLPEPPPEPDLEPKSTPKKTPRRDPMAVAKAERLQKLKDRLTQARTYARRNPKRFDDVIRRFQQLSREAVGTEVETAAQTAAEQWARKKLAAIDDVRAGLARQADGLAAKGDFNAAKALLNNYRGAFAKETEAARSSLVKRLERDEKIARRQDLEAMKQAGAKLDKVKRELALLVLKQDFDAAAATLAACRKDDLLARNKEVLALSKDLLNLQRIPELIAGTFADQKGKVITIDLKRGRVKAEIVSVVGSRVTARRKIKFGYTAVKFGVMELSIRERMGRLAHAAAPVADTLKGILSARGNRRDAAKKYFGRAATPLARVVLANLPQAPVAPPVDTAEEDAEDAYKDLLRTANLPLTVDDDRELVGLMDRRPYTKGDVDRIKQELASFKKNHGNRKAARRHAAVIGALARLKPFSESRVKRALERLVKDNPALKNGFNKSYKLSDGQLTVMLENNPGLKDISGLKGLPITTLALNNTKVKDIRPLQGMPLDDLGLWNCPVDDIRPLRDMPLTVLSLNKTQITDIKDLRGMQLIWLDLSYTNVDDIAVLRGMPIQKIKLEDCRKLRNISPLADCRDLSAILIPPSPKSISFLKELPNVRYIGTTWKEEEMKAPDFWRKYGRKYR